MKRTTTIINRLNSVLLAFAYACNALVARRYHGMVQTRESRRLMQAVGIATTVLAIDQVLMLVLNGNSKKRAVFAAIGRMLFVAAMYFSSWRFWTSFVTAEDEAQANAASVASANSASNAGGSNHAR